jgi:hypothetical protein
MLNQKEAVYAAILSVKGSIDGRVTLSKEETNQVVSMLVDGFKSGKISLNKSYTDAELRKYTVGLVNNWLRKDNRLNGGEKYVAKNPGSRTGSSDEQLKALKALRSMLTDPAEIAEVDSYIERRTQEIVAERVKKSIEKINPQALPESLHHLLSNK